MFYYDLYMSLGPACRPAYYLENNDLRTESYPLDWQMAYSLDTVLHLFRTKFNDFFVDIEEDEIGGVRNNRRIKDVKNNIISIHHFPREISVETAQAEFLQKMNRRFEKLEEKLVSADKIVLLCNRSDSIEKLQIFLLEFSSLYPQLQIKLINIRNNETMEGDTYDKKSYALSDYLTIEEYIFNDAFDSTTKEKFDWRGNVRMWRRILEDYDNRNNNKLEMMEK